MTDSNGIIIRPVTSEDIKKIADLERMCFSVPMTENNLESLLIGRNGCGFVLYDTQIDDIRGLPLAYGGMLCVLDEAQILNIATHPEFRRNGYGRKITESLIAEAKRREIVTVTLEVRMSNDAAQKLYRGFGFYEVGILKNYYKHPTEDGLILKLDVK